MTKSNFCFLHYLEDQLDFPVLYASAKEGWASSTFTKEPPADGKNMSQLLDAIIRHVPPPKADLDEPFLMLVISNYELMKFLNLGGQYCICNFFQFSESYIKQLILELCFLTLARQTNTIYMISVTRSKLYQINTCLSF